MFEILIVLLIVGIATALVVPSLPRRDVADRLAADAGSLVATAQRLRHYAVLSHRPAGLMLSDSGYRTLTYLDATWVPLQITGVRANVRFSRLWTVEWRYPRSTPPGLQVAPPIIMLPQGTMTPFAVTLKPQTGSPPLVEIAADSAGMLSTDVRTP